MRKGIKLLILHLYLVSALRDLNRVTGIKIICIVLISLNIESNISLLRNPTRVILTIKSWAEGRIIFSGSPRRVSSVAFERKWNRSAYNATSNEYSGWPRLSRWERNGEPSSSSSSRWNAQYDPAAFATATRGLKEDEREGGGWMALGVYFSACEFSRAICRRGKRRGGKTGRN